MEKAKTENNVELVEAKVLIPRQVLEFLKAAHDFGKWKESLEEYMGDQIVMNLEADFGDLLEGMWNMKEIIEGYGLDKAPTNLEPTNYNHDC